MSRSSNFRYILLAAFGSEIIISSISAKGILKPLAEAQAVFDQEFGQNTILGPEGRTYWIYAPYNYITKWVAELKKSAFNSAGLAGSIFHQRSYWLFNLSDLHKDPDGTVKPLGPNKNTENFGISTFNNMKQQGLSLIHI